MLDDPKLVNPPTGWSNKLVGLPGRQAWSDLDTAVKIALLTMLALPRQSFCWLSILIPAQHSPPRRAKKTTPAGQDVEWERNQYSNNEDGSMVCLNG